MKFLNRKHLERLGRPGPIALGILGLIIIGAIILSVVFTKKQQAASQPREAPGVPVTIATVTVETVPLQVAAIGAAEPYSTVSVKSEVNGQMMKVYFTQGQFVKKGDPLFT